MIQNKKTEAHLAKLAAGKDNSPPPNKRGSIGTVAVLEIKEKLHREGDTPSAAPYVEPAEAAAEETKTKEEDEVGALPEPET